MYLWSASRLRDGIDDWKEITPQPVQRAVEALRRNFELQAWKVGQIMMQGCRPALHKGLTEQARQSSRLMAQQLGHPVLPTVDEGQTEPIVFSSYFYRCAHLLAGDLRLTFFALRDIALAQSTLISGPPVDWAAIQAKVLVADVSYRISFWLKCTCDKWPELMGDDLEWKSWRAPRWLCMEPFANPPYDSDKAWERMDEADTKHMLEVIEDRFNQSLVMELEKAVDEAYVRMAIEPPTKVTHAESPQAPKTEQKPGQEPTTAGSPSLTREAFIKPILENKGFSVHDWARTAGVDFHTADNYLKGKTKKPFPATRKKLADALGVEVVKLPA